MNRQKLETFSLKPEQIIEYCQQNFINILPNTQSKESKHSQIRSQESPHEKQELKIIMKQLSIFLQLTIQNCVLTSDPKIKSQSFKILGRFRNFLSRDLDDFENLIFNRNRTKLPFYEVDCKDFLNRDLVVKIPPQVSLYQDPLLFYNYSRLAQEELFCNLSIMKTRQQRIEIIKNHVPFLDPNFIPIVGERLETKAKFTELEDRLLLILLSLHEKKDIGYYRSIYFPNRQESTIRNRAKNLCAKDMNNSVKKMRENQYLPLTEEEQKIVCKAYNRFGPRWPVIAKYYKIRSGNMLEAEYENNARLQKLRKLYSIETKNYIKPLLDKQSPNKETKQKVNAQEQSFSMDAEEYYEGAEEGQPVYKIINHLTFLYEQI